MENNDPAKNDEALSGTPGQILRRCREFQNMSLQDASESTKISKSYLRALEEDRPEEFASKAYLKGFLQLYATHLGLNVEDMLRMMEKEHPEPESAEKKLAPEKRIENRRRIWRRLFLPVLLLGAIILTALFYTPARQTFVRTTSPIPPPPAKAVLKPQSSSVNSANHAKDVSVATPHSSLIKGGLIVHMKVLKNGSMTVGIDGSISQPYDLSAGDIIEWKADRIISMELSDGSGVELLMNGKPLGLSAQPGKPASVNIDSTGIIRR